MGGDLEDRASTLREDTPKMPPITAEICESCGTQVEYKGSQPYCPKGCQLQDVRFSECLS